MAEQLQPPGIRKGQMPLARGLGCPQNLVYFIFRWEILMAEQLQPPGIRKGQMPLARGLGCPQNLVYFIFRWEILMAEWQGRPQGSPLPDCIASMCTVQCMISNKR